MNQKARDIADFQRIERGYFDESDKLKGFETLKKKMTPMEVEIFQERLCACLGKQAKAPVKPKPDQKPPKKDKVK